MEINRLLLGYRKYFVLALLLMMGVKPATAQFYPTQFRPPGQSWQQLSTNHFKIIFPANNDSAAYQTAHILEQQYPAIRPLTGGKLARFPLILNGYNDRSNGFVTSLHFRSEIDISPAKGKTLNPINGGWLQNVAPHELTHAVQFSHLGRFGVGRIVDIFSPDLARSIHGAAPSGIQEGLAVYHESNGVVRGGGRGNYPFFINQFEAEFNSPDRWSLGQMVQAPAYNRPFNRNYIGGYEFTQWLQDTYGPATSRHAVDFHVRWPFLGYGIALKHATGKWPGQLYHRFVHDKNQSMPAAPKRYLPLPIDLDGPDIRRPRWLSDSTLVFYGSFYNAKPGFYRYDLTSSSLKRLITTSSVSGFHYALSPHKTSLVYSYYGPDVIYPRAYKTQLVKASLTDGSTRKIASRYRLYAPAFRNDSTLLALQVNHTHAALVELKPGSTASPATLFTRAGRLIKAVAVNPRNPDSLAAVLNHNGNQALWLASTKTLQDDLAGPPTISFSGGSIFDPVWSPDGRRLLFSADFTGRLQVYEYDLPTGRITRLTHAAYSAFEASYSPDGKKIAFIIQRKNNRLPVVLPRNEIKPKLVDTSSRTGNKITPPGLTVSTQPDSSWTRHDYSTSYSWLKPRTLAPVIKETSGSNLYRFGAGFHSSDLLQQQAYSLEATVQKSRLWYDLTYQNKQFFPGLKARVFSKPAFRSFRFKNSSGQQFGQTFLRQERSFALSEPISFTFRQNVSTTSLYVEPELRLSQIRYFNEAGRNPSDFSNALIGNVYGQFNYRLQQDIRSVQPNSGLLLYSEVEHYFRAGSLSLNSRGGKVPLNFASPTALRGGLYGYVSPFRRWNQSLRAGLEGITQTQPLFDNQFLVSNGFSDDAFPLAHNLVSLSGRYTVPLFYPDNGGLLIPLYLSSLYLVGFADTVTDPSEGGLFSSSRTVVGGGLRIQFRLSNLAFDIGFGIGFEPSRNNLHYFIGDF